MNFINWRKATIFNSNKTSSDKSNISQFYAVKSAKVTNDRSSSSSGISSSSTAPILLNDVWKLDGFYQASNKNIIDATDASCSLSSAGLTRSASLPLGEFGSFFDDKLDPTSSTSDFADRVTLSGLLPVGSRGLDNVLSRIVSSKYFGTSGLKLGLEQTNGKPGRVQHQQSAEHTQASAVSNSSSRGCSGSRQFAEASISIMERLSRFLDKPRFPKTLRRTPVSKSTSRAVAPLKFSDVGSSRENAVCSVDVIVEKLQQIGGVIKQKQGYLESSSDSSFLIRTVGGVDSMSEAPNLFASNLSLSAIYSSAEKSLALTHGDSCSGTIAFEGGLKYNAILVDSRMWAEVRHLPAKARRVITADLDAGGAWQELAAEIRHPDRICEPLFEESHVRLLAAHQRTAGSGPSDEILRTWSTTGRNRPRVVDLFKLLVHLQRERLAYLLAGELGVSVPLSPVLNGRVPTHVSKAGSDKAGSVEKDLHSSIPMAGCIDAAALQPYLSGVYRLCFSSVLEATQNFSSKSHNKIGEGQFGSVYRIKINGEDMALKRLHQEHADIFFNEIETMAALDHPNVLGLRAVSIQDDCRCIITKYMPNGTLESKLRTEVLAWIRRISVLRDVAAGLSYLHSLKIVHRDVKPANILLDANMNAVLGDLGLARAKCNLRTSITQVTAGTLLYMPIEAVRGEVTQKSDVWAMGVVVLELLTGLSVFDPARSESYLTNYVHGKLVSEVIDKRLEEPPEQAAAGLLATAQQCLSDDRNARPSAASLQNSFGDILDALSAAIT